MNSNTHPNSFQPRVREFSRRAQLQSSTLRRQEWQPDPPTTLGLFTLKRHADAHARAIREGLAVAPEVRRAA